MPSVTIRGGKYWVGNPKSIFPEWEESPSCTYREGQYTYQAFKFKKSFIAVIPFELIETLKKQPKSGKVYEFEQPFVFHESDGSGFVATIEL